MIKFNVEILKRQVEVVLWHRWDCPGPIVAWEDLDENAIGKCVMFDDGSELIVEVEGFNKGAVRTNAGVFRKEDIVHICNPKAPNASYSGMYGRQEHLLVRPLGKQEKGLITRHVRGDKLKMLTPRIEIGALERVGNEIKRQGMSLEENTGLLISIARRPGNKQLDAVDRIFASYGIDLKSGVKKTGLDDTGDKQRGAFHKIEEAQVINNDTVDNIIDDLKGLVD